MAIGEDMRRGKVDDSLAEVGVEERVEIRSVSRSSCVFRYGPVAGPINDQTYNGSASVHSFFDFHDVTYSSGDPYAARTLQACRISLSSRLETRCQTPAPCHRCIKMVCYLLISSDCFRFSVSTVCMVQWKKVIQ